MNLRLRMVAAGEPYSPAYRSLYLGMAAPPVTPSARSSSTENPSSRLYRAKGSARRCIHGPAMITEYTSATVLPPGCTAHVDGFGNLVISVRRCA